MDDSKEFFLSVGLDAILAPTLTVYREVSKYQGWYLNLMERQSTSLAA